VRVHNIGSFPAHDIRIELTVDGVEAGSAVIDRIEAPNNLEPRWKEVVFDSIRLTSIHNIAVTIKTTQQEITRLNNSASCSWPPVIH
jgi:hypothetical protein